MNKGDIIVLLFLDKFERMRWRCKMWIFKINKENKYLK